MTGGSTGSISGGGSLVSAAMPGSGGVFRRDDETWGSKTGASFRPSPHHSPPTSNVKTAIPASQGTLELSRTGPVADAVLWGWFGSAGCVGGGSFAGRNGAPQRGQDLLGQSLRLEPQAVQNMSEP
ncbi:MAG: hypothetical protein LBT71_03255 [Azoarcus sp.]|nr:hypothetical protein [Azoarcus sp.]